MSVVWGWPQSSSLGFPPADHTQYCADLGAASRRGCGPAVGVASQDVVLNRGHGRPIVSLVNVGARIELPGRVPAPRDGHSSDSIRNSVYFSLLARPGSCLRVVSGVSSQSRCAPSGVMVSPRRSHPGWSWAVPLVVCVLDICPEGVGAAVVDLSSAVAVRRPDLAVGTVGKR